MAKKIDTKSYKADVNSPAVKAKAKKVDEVKKAVKEYGTIALIDLRMLPDSLLQSIRKKIREDGGSVVIAKRAIMERVFDSVKAFSNKKGELKKPVGLILTKSSPYQLNMFFKSNKKKRAAKINEVAPFNIVVPEGETDLPPGPALSELKSAGLNVQIKGGKIVVAKESTVAKKGEPITDVKVKALQKLNIMPFETAVNLLFAYDGEYIYSKEILDIDPTTLTPELQTAFRDAFNLSMNACVPTTANIDMLLQEAYRQAVNASVNGSLYSNSSIEQLLSSAVRQGMALAVLENK
jgi:large subunit ribosomal protein L10